MEENKTKKKKKKNTCSANECRLSFQLRNPELIAVLMFIRVCDRPQFSRSYGGCAAAVFITLRKWAESRVTLPSPQVQTLGKMRPPLASLRSRCSLDELRLTAAVKKTGPPPHGASAAAIVAKSGLRF